MNKTEIITTKCGQLFGIDNGDWSEYRGIEYAKAKRWEYPTEITQWDGIYDASSWGACSYQRRGFEDDEKCNAFYHKEFRKGLSFEYSEDCLYLNIWTPKDKKDCPVVIYIHGGSFTGGSANEGHISGADFAKNGIIFVALNYRLGPFGFCSHPDLKGGNYGLMDQICAISWIKNNIDAFGGDSSNITLLGQSAGAMSVDILISSPLCKGWFKHAIMMSGAGLQRAVARPAMPEKTKEFWNTIVKNAGVTTIEELKDVDEKTLFYAWSDACKTEKKSMLYTLPVNDGKIITKDSFNIKSIPSDIDYMLGVTSTDMAPIALEIITKKWAKASEKAGAKCYVYNFFRDLPGDNSGAWHSCDLLYAFNTLGNNWRPFEDIDYTIAKQISNAIYSFARTGNPNCTEIPKWDTGCKKPMRFCEDTEAMPWDTSTMIKNTFSNKGAEF